MSAHQVRMPSWSIFFSHRACLLYRLLVSLCRMFSLLKVSDIGRLVSVGLFVPCLSPCRRSISLLKAEGCVWSSLLTMRTATHNIVILKSNGARALGQKVKC